jgi:hypothetical protein
MLAHFIAMLAHFIHIASTSDPSYDAVNAISTRSSKTFLATTSKDNSPFVPTLHEGFKVNIWSEKETVLGDSAHRVFSANSKHERRNKTFRSSYWKYRKMQQGVEGVGKKIMYVHSWHVFRMGKSGAVDNHSACQSDTVKADSHTACHAHAVPMPSPCHVVPLIHTCHAAPLPCSDSAVSFVKLRVVAGNIRTPSPTV